MEFIIFFSGLLVGLLLFFMGTYKPQELGWNPNDYSLPPILPLVDVKGVARGFNVDGASITLSWVYSGATQSRVITKRNGVLTQEEFLKHWHENELNFYLQNKEMFDKELNK